MSSTPTHDLTPIVPRRTVVTERSYSDAERAVDWLSEEGFPVERVRIVGSGLHSVEKVLGRVTTGRAALMGAAQGGAVGILVGLLFGVFFTTTAAFFGALLYGLLLGTFWGGVWGAMLQRDRAGGWARLATDTVLRRMRPRGSDVTLNLERNAPSHRYREEPDREGEPGQCGYTERHRADPRCC